uniref:Major facilitator superfamily (MFS) profile domain-containing protein n=1 Tax=Photinus pyralis TaxID=7054 RepID=A0A1Y1M5U2_PHOPY
MMLKGRQLQYFGTCLALLNMMGKGMHLAWPSPFLPILEGDPSTAITKDEGSWIATSYLISDPLGDIIISLLLNRIGRKYSLLVSAIPFLISWIIIAITQRFGFIILARLIAGIGGGAIFTVLPIYIGELADPQIRGSLISLMVIVISVGALSINILGYYVTITHASIICALPSVLFLLLFPFLPETPNYYIVKGNMDKAREMLTKIRGKVVGDEEIKELVKNNEEGLVRAGVLDLFRVASNRKGLFIFMGTMTAQQVAGIVPIMYFYTQTIFIEAAADFPVIASTAILYLVLIVCSVISAALIDRLGRRPLLLTSTACCCLALLMEGVNLYLTGKGGGNSGFTWMTIGNISFLIVGYSIGLLTLPSIFMSELFPLNIKGVAVCFCNMFFSIMATTVTKLFQFTNDQYGLYVPFFVFSGLCFVTLVYVAISVPETKKKTLEQIQMELRVADGESKTKL